MYPRENEERDLEWSRVKITERFSALLLAQTKSIFSLTWEFVQAILACFIWSLRKASRNRNRPRLVRNHVRRV